MSDGQRYEVLHYAGDVTSANGAKPGEILGHDEVGRYYEVIDAEFDPVNNRTTVQLQYASVENISAAMVAAGITS